jgi:flavin reductase (DIM6/NTAB) family NADH-FMN oxidoreductase RutF
LKVCSTVTFANQNKPEIDQKATHNLTYGLFVITSKHGDIDNGQISNTAFQVASDPTRLAISIQKNNYTKEIIQKSGIFNVSVLTDDVDFETIRHFGMQSGRDVNKFENFTAKKRSHNGVFYLNENANAFFSCKVVEQKDLGSHTLFIGEVTEAKVLNKKSPCTYAHYHKSIKPKF